MLSNLSNDELDAYLSQTCLIRYTQYTITTSDGLLAEIAAIRAQGFAIDNQEHELDVRCIALPIRLKDGTQYAISVSAPSYRMSDSHFANCLLLLRRCQALILERAQHTL